MKNCFLNGTKCLYLIICTLFQKSWIFTFFIFLGLILASMQYPLFALLYSRTISAFGENSLESLRSTILHCSAGFLVGIFSLFLDEITSTIFLQAICVLMVFRFFFSFFMGFIAESVCKSVRVDSFQTLLRHDHSYVYFILFFCVF